MKERKFTDEEVKEIKFLIAAEMKTSAIVKKFNRDDRPVNKMDISNIKNKKYYKDID